MAMKVELIDELLKGCTTQEDVFDENGIFYAKQRVSHPLKQNSQCPHVV